MVTYSIFKNVFDVILNLSPNSCISCMKAWKCSHKGFKHGYWRKPIFIGKYEHLISIFWAAGRHRFSSSPLHACPRSLNTTPEWKNKPGTWYQARTGRDKILWQRKGTKGYRWQTIKTTAALNGIFTLKIKRSLHFEAIPEVQQSFSNKLSDNQTRWPLVTPSKKQTW